MFKSLKRWLGVGNDDKEIDKYEPIYGLPKRSFNAWLARNPARKKDYEAKLLERSRRSRPLAIRG